MKSWQLRMVGMTMICCLAVQILPAWANTGNNIAVAATAPVTASTEGITHHIQNHPNHQRHTPLHRSLEPVTADIQSTDTENSMHHWDVRSSVQVSREQLRDALKIL